MNELSLQASTTALVVIDLQRGIVAMSTQPRPSSEVVQRTATLADVFRAKGSTVIWVHVDLPSFRRLAVDQHMMDPNGPPPPPESVELVPEAGKKPDELLITKRFWGAFEGTPLEAELHKRGIETVVVAGIATNFGVESTARSAAGLGFNVVVVEDATASRSAEGHRFAIDHIFPLLGRVRKAAEVEAALA